MKKRLFCLFLAVWMTLSLCACGKDSEKDTENKTPSSNAEMSAPEAEIIPTPDEQGTPKEQTPEESEQPQASADGVDVDLTALSSTMVYSEVYNMLYFYPEDYYGKTVKMTGLFNVYQSVDENGVVLDMPPTPVSFQTRLPAAPRVWNLCWRVTISTRTIIRNWARRSLSSVSFNPMRKMG